MAELKPCPFCEDKDAPFVNKKFIIGGDWHWVECDCCGARGPIYMPKQAAIAAWNKRSK